MSFAALELQAVRAQFTNLRAYESVFEKRPDWPYLLFCASILAPSEIAQAEERSLRIAQTALTDRETTNAERDAALIILDALSNRRAISLAEERNFVPKGIAVRLGTTQSIDWLRRSIENRIDFDDGRSLLANKFQRTFWEAAGQFRWLSVSAPTSAGKSYILTQFLIENIKSDHFRRIVYIAPTRALIQQVEIDFQTTLATSNVLDVDLRSIPQRDHRSVTKKEILVFTQERLHYYLEMYGAAGIDALVIDESHKIGDGSRGILLQHVIERVARENHDAKVIFTAPLAENPDTLLFGDLGASEESAFRSDTNTVNQNLLWIAADEDSAERWEMSLRRAGKSEPLGTFDIGKSLNTIKSRIAHLALSCSTGDGGTLIYADGAARAEEIAEKVASLVAEKSSSKEISSLDELCRETIHKKFALRRVIKKGVAFHYGNMPLILRTSIEDLFRDGHIKYLVCTSTLVEGVNLPCRNIIVRAPKKGKKEPMSAPDFWNLAGRAGRWGKEFQGNVICIDTDDKDAWGEFLPSSKTRYSIERASDRILKEKEPLLQYVRSGAPSYFAEKSTELESAVSYLAAVRNEHGSLTEAPWKGRIPTNALEEIDEVLERNLQAIEIPNEWVRRHAGISPFAMQRMTVALTRLKTSIDDFIPIDPEEDKAAQQFGRIFQLISHHMTTVFGTGGRCNALGILTTNWMMGYPISRIISERRKWNKKKGRKESIDSTIRKVFMDVEQIARFQAPRYLSCYSDIVRVELQRREMFDQASAIPDLTLPLEFGVRGNLQLFLMGVGLSRSSTLAIAEPLREVLREEGDGDRSFDIREVVDGIRRLNEFDLKLPSLVAAELEALTARFTE